MFETAAKQDSLKHTQATYFTYDIHGNVDTTIQDFTIASLPSGNNRFFKKLVYGFDLISGKVNYVAYQPGVMYEQFYHRYTYDAENRLTDVETSTDSLYWEHDAYYTYFKHGPLARMVLGHQRVQGLDYAYTLQGWLKGVNSTAPGSTNDMGADGYSAGSNNYTVARDVYGFALYYYGNTDYKPIKSTETPFAPVPVISGASSQPFKALYNGNIGSMVVNINAFGVNANNGVGNKPLAYMYSYDQLNRIVAMNTVKNNGTNFSGNTWTNPSLTNDYKESITYDANGNILSYFRDSAGTSDPLMDKLRYEYYANTNKLNYVYDTVSTPNTAGDIESQSVNNYDYDKIGNLIKDNAEGITNIEWNVYGKIKKITKTGNKTITYTYDAMGNRISKSVDGTETWYVRDGSGNVMSVYTVSSSTITLSEVNMYGSRLFGTIKANINLTSPPAFSKVGTVNGDSLIVYSFVRGLKTYILGNHLDNVNVTISDKKKGIASTGTTVSYYTADVVSAIDYYPFGMSMPGRTYTAGGAGSYRYGFNGKENDKDINGGTQDYGMRIYDRRIGRFLSVDPLSDNFAFYSPYHFGGNNPIRNLDLDGGEPRDYSWNWKYRDLYDMNSKEKVSANDQTFTVYDTKLGYLEASMVYDNWTKTTWFVAKKGDDYYYLKNDNGNPTEMRIHPQKNSDKNIVRGGQFVKFEAQERRQARVGSESADILAECTFGLAVTGCTLSAAIYGQEALWNGLINTKNLGWGGTFVKESAKKIVAAHGDLSKVDWYDVGASTVSSKLKLGIWGKAGVELINAAVDVNINNNGIVGKTVGYNKPAYNVFTDVTFSGMKLLLGEVVAKDLNASDQSKEFLKMVIDQNKTLVKNILAAGSSTTPSGNQ